MRERKPPAAAIHAQTLFELVVPSSLFTMSIRCEVARLADLVANANAPLSSWERRLHNALRQINEVDDLGWWDSHYHHVHWYGSSEEGLAVSSTVQLFDAIFEFGTYNLYGQFDLSGTAESYKALVNHLNAELDQNVPNRPPPTEW